MENLKGIDLMDYINNGIEPKYLPFDSSFVLAEYKEHQFIEKVSVWWKFNENLKKFPLKYDWKLNEEIYEKCMQGYVSGFDYGYNSLIETLKQTNIYEINNEFLLNRIQTKLQDLETRSMNICDLVTLFFDNHLEEASRSLGIEQLERFEKVGIESGEHLKALESVRDYFSAPSKITETTTLLQKEKETTTHPIHDSNLWSFESYELFKYLKDKYHRSTIKQITNIWFYLKHDTDVRYKCTATKDEYKEFIKVNYSIIITNFDKPKNYDSKPLISMNNHLIYYKKTLK